MAEQLAELNKRECDIYSTDEKVVGTYLGKPLYQRTFSLTNPADGDLLMTGVDKCFTIMVGFSGIINGYAYYNSDLVLSSNNQGVLGIRAYVCQFTSGSRNIGDVLVGLAKGTNWSSVPSADITLRYTKM